MLQKTGERMALLLILLPMAALLGTVCIDSKGLPSGELIAQYAWLEQSLLWFAAATGLAALLAYRKFQFFLRPEDGLVACIGLYLLLHYDFELLPSEVRVYLLGNCILAWFILRTALSTFPELHRGILWMITSFGVYEALLGMLQIYGWKASNHGLFTLTGTFFNPGPYSGYLAVAFAVGIGLYATETNRWLRHLMCVMLVAIGVLLPAGMSRSAWLAAGSGCLVVWLMNPGNRMWINVLWKKHRWLRRVLPAGGAALLIALLTGLFLLKPDSANGRFFMWKITARAVAEHPWIGYGMGQFATAYGDAQEAYFAAGLGNEREEYVAGTPEYAFNEYLQLATEGGIPLLVLAVYFAGLSLWRGLRRKRAGAVAGAVAFGVFAFSSYPTQFPGMLIVGWMLLGVCQAPEKKELFTVIPRWCHVAIAAPYALVYALFLSFTSDSTAKTMEACRTWQTARLFYNTKAYTVAEKEYAKLYTELQNRPAFVFEYAMCLRNLEAWQESNAQLEHALKLSGDPMILNVMGRNYTDLGYRENGSHQGKGNWAKSETCFQRSIHRLPGRLYPYYLLAKLYNTPEYSHPELARKMARIVLDKKEKIPSTAIREMRKEIKKILNIK